MRRLGFEQKRILIIDPASGPDDQLVHLLTANGFHVGVADSSAAAWEAITLELPDLVLLESMLPNGTEGFHFVWQLRDHPDESTRRIPILILSRIHQTTALNLFPDFHDGHYVAREYLPVQGFLNKPVDHDKLLGTVQSIFKTAAVGF